MAKKAPVTEVAAEEQKIAVDPLIEHGLRFGGLLKIGDERVVERYNRALAAFGLPSVAVAPMWVDLCGFSLEVALALGDMHYLDPAQVNPRFIIVSADQARAPLVHSSFSSTKKLFQQFFAANAEAIGLVTLKDALYGEIENSLLNAETIEDIVRFPHVDFELHTVDGLIEDAADLSDMVERFMTDETAWTDFALMEDIVRLSAKCGDIRRNPIRFHDTRFGHPTSFSTTMFGGATIVEGDIIGRPDKVKATKSRVIDVRDCAAVMDYLTANHYVELPNMEWLVDSHYIEHRLEMLAADILAEKIPSLEPFVTSKYPEALMQNNVVALMASPLFKELDRLRTLAINSGHDAAVGHFLSMSAEGRAAVSRAVPDKPWTNDVNRVLSTYFPVDHLVCFILDKPAFYARFKKLDPVRRQFAVDLIKTRYMPYNGSKSDNHKRAVKDVFFGTHDI